MQKLLTNVKKAQPDGRALHHSSSLIDRRISNTLSCSSTGSWSKIRIASATSRIYVPLSAFDYIIHQLVAAVN